MMLRRLLLAIALLIAAPAAAEGPLVLAAASLQGALDQVADRWARAGHERPVLSYAASSTLARQVLAGAPADLFISADEAWMDAVAAKGAIVPRSRIDLLGNRLVLIAPRASARPVRIARGFPIGQRLGPNGRLAMADPAGVPAGRYGETALTRLGVWPQVSGRIARAENVRAALALVERGAAPLGIVYATDARASERVAVVGLFPPTSHPPIRYPLARLSASRNPDAAGFHRFLRSSAAQAIFRRHGFLIP